jgi:hypothetical protein
MAVRRTHFWIFASSAILAGALVFALVREDAPVQSQRLPDGTVISIPKVSYGKVHRYNPGTVWEGMAAKILPAGLRIRFGIRDRNVAITNATDTIVLFVQAYRSNGTFSGAPAMPTYFMSSAVMQDDIGNDLPARNMYASLARSNVLVEAFEIPLVSHTATELRLNLQHRDVKVPSAMPAETEFKFHNPAPRSIPRWRAQPLPLTNFAGDVAVELLELQTITNNTPHQERDSGIMLGQLTTLRTRARFRLLQNGAPTDRWEVGSLTVYDEDGNAFRPLPSYGRTPGTSEFEGGLSSWEARRFVFELARVPPFEVDEVATLTNVMQPGSTGTSVRNTLNFQGYTLQINQLTHQDDFQQIRLHYQISPLPGGYLHHIILKAVRESGQETILVDHNGGGTSGGNVGIGQSRPRVSGNYRVDLVFALTKSRMVEFLAKPEGPQIKNSK